jgi:hypothetical protein
VADTAARLSDRVVEVVSAVAGLVRDEIEDLRDEALTGLLYAAVEGNVITFLRALRCGIAVENVRPPAAALEHARRLAQHGVPVNPLVRAYRLGQRLTELVCSSAAEIDMRAQARITMVETIAATRCISYIDRVSEQVVAVYEEERERWLDAPTPVDVDAASAAIRYPLRWHHLALVMWHLTAGDADELARLHGLVREPGAGTDVAARFAVHGRERGAAGRRQLATASAPCPAVPRPRSSGTAAVDVPQHRATQVPDPLGNHAGCHLLLTLIAQKPMTSTVLPWM